MRRPLRFPGFRIGITACGVEREDASGRHPDIGPTTPEHQLQATGRTDSGYHQPLILVDQEKKHTTPSMDGPLLPVTKGIATRAPHT